MFFSHEGCKLPYIVSKTLGDQHQLLCMRFSGTVAASSTLFTKKVSDHLRSWLALVFHRWAVCPVDFTALHGLPWQVGVGCLCSFESNG